MRKLLIAALLALGPQAVLAANSGPGVYLGLSAGKYDSSRSGSSLGEVKDNRTTFDVKLGYLLESSIYLGAIYSSFSQNASTESPSSTAYGATLGYHGENGLFFDLNYYFSATRNVSSSFKLIDGSGVGADFGYNVMVSSSVYLGLQLSYRSYVYKRGSIPAGEWETENKTTELSPLLNLGFYF